MSKHGHMTVTDININRPDYATCACGEAWFELRNPDDHPAPHGALSLRADSQTINGYTGTPHCIACGNPL